VEVDPPLGPEQLSSAAHFLVSERVRVGVASSVSPSQVQVVVSGCVISAKLNIVHVKYMMITYVRLVLTSNDFYLCICIQLHVLLENVNNIYLCH